MHDNGLSSDIAAAGAALPTEPAQGAGPRRSVAPAEAAARPTAAPGAPSVFREVVRRVDRHDVYVSGIARAPITDAGGLDAFLAEVAAALPGVTLLQARIYGLRARQGAILDAAHRAFQARRLAWDFPVTFLEGAPCVGGDLAGVQITGVITGATAAAMAGRPSPSIETLRDGDAVVGRVLRSGRLRQVFLSGVSGAIGNGSPAPAGDQAEQMLRRAAAQLEPLGLAPRQIIRTWIYLPRLLHWYGEFNRARTATFRDLGILDAHGRGRLPASTGIQGARSDAEECFMDVLAIDRLRDGDGDPVAVPMRNPRQNEATDYGSSFARGMAVMEDPETLYLSGTASIDPSGRSMYTGDAQGQVTETLLNVAALLDARGAALGDIRLGTAYCKDERTYRTFERVMALLGLGALPLVPVLADVCRDELLFEIDSLAVARRDAGTARTVA